MCQQLHGGLQGWERCEAMPVPLHGPAVVQHEALLTCDPWDTQVQVQV